MDWILLAQDSYDYQVLVNMVINIVNFQLNYIILTKSQYHLVLLLYLFVG